jgi:hypothetical protein
MIVTEPNLGSGGEKGSPRLPLAYDSGAGVRLTRRDSGTLLRVLFELRFCYLGLSFIRSTFWRLHRPLKLCILNIPGKEISCRR